MFPSRFRSAVNIFLLSVVGLAVFVLVAWLGYNAGLNAAEGLAPTPKPSAVAKGADVFLTPISLAENINLSKATGLAAINRQQGQASIDIALPTGSTLPVGAVLEAWLVDAGQAGGLGESSVSENDQKYGTPFANVDFSASVDSAPFAFSLGALAWDEGRGSWHLFADAERDWSPFDAIMVTVESDANAGNYDPRPGTPVLIGKIEESK